MNEFKGSINIWTALALVAVVALTFVSVNQSGLAYPVNDTDTANITVYISSKNMIDISPNVMNFTIMDPGEVKNGYNNTEGSNAGFLITGFQIENVGSTNISYVWLNVTQPSSNPYGTGNPNNYDPANFIAVNRTGTNYSYVDRLEYNATDPIIYLNLDSNARSNGRYGRVRSAFNEYFWQINGTCSNTDSYFIIGDTPHNKTQTGTIDLQNGDITAIKLSGGTGGWFYGSTALSKDFLGYGIENYVVLVDNSTCTKIRLVRWNADILDQTNSESVLSDYGFAYNSTTEGQLYPGSSFDMGIQMRVPYGVAQGQLPTGVLTVVAYSI